MARRQVYPGRVSELRDASQECPLGMLAGVRLVLLRAEPGADQRARDVAPGVVRQLDRTAQHAAWHRDGALTERLLLLLAQPVEVLLRLDVRPDHRLFVACEVGVERADARCRIYVDH